MPGYALRVVEDRMGPRAALALPAAHRVVYVVDGGLDVSAGGPHAPLGANEAWQGGGACQLTAGDEGALAWRWELGPADRVGDPRSDAGGVLKLAREVQLETGERYLMRCDRVDFPLGGVAYTHTHRGPGIRVLLRGGFRVETGGHTIRLGPGEAWFESGPEPVYAAASDSELTSFVRVLVLPAELQGQSSIRYVRPEDQDKPRTQRYTVFVDAAIAI